LENPVSQNTYRQLDQSHKGFRSTIGLKEEYKEENKNREIEEKTQSPKIETSVLDKQTAYIRTDSFELTNYQKDKETLEPFRAQYRGHFTHYMTDTEIFEAAENLYNGTIWILVDDTVYSSSENFVMFCKNTGFAALVGASTGGDGGIADPLLVALPNSGLIVLFSVFYGLNGDGSGNEANGTKPDIVLSENEDALKKCLERIDD